MLALKHIIGVSAEMNMTNMVQLQTVIRLVQETQTKSAGEIGHCLCHTLQTVSRNNVMLVALKILN